jgi:hypothetical protein
MFAVTPSVFSVFDFEGNSWWAHKGSNNIVISMPYADDGAGFSPSGTAKTEKIVPSLEATAKQPSRSGMSG